MDPKLQGQEGDIPANGFTARRQSLLQDPSTFRGSVLSHGILGGQASPPPLTPPSSTSSEDEQKESGLRRRRTNKKKDDDSSSDTDEVEAGQKSVDKIVAIIERRLEEKLKAGENETENEQQAGANHWMFAILFLLAVLFICHTAAAIYLFTLEEPFEHPYTCLSSNCKSMAKWLKDAMNESVDPCEDFYNFTCGTFLTNNPAPKYDKSKPMTFIEGIPYRFKGHAQLGRFLRPVKPYPANQILPFYQSCIYLKRRNKIGYRPLVHLLARLKLLHPNTGNSKRPNIARRMVRIFKLTNKMPFIEVQGLTDNYIMVGMGKSDKEIESTNPQLYSKTVRKSFELLKNFLLIKDKDELETIVYQVVRFEAELFTLQGKGLSTRVFGFPNNMDKYVKVPKKLHVNWNERTGSFSWDDLIDEMFFREHPKENPRAVILFNWRHSILERSKDDRFYLVALEQFLRRTPWYTLFRYFQWMLIKGFGFELTEKLQRLMSNLFPEAGNSGESRCFRSVFFNLNALAAERYMMDVKDFNKTDYQMNKINQLVYEEIMEVSKKYVPSNIRQQISKSLTHLNITTVKIKELSPFIPTFYAGLNMSDEKYFENVITARVMKSINDIKQMRRIWPYESWPRGSYSLDLVTKTDSVDEFSDWRILHVPFGAMVEPFVGNDLPILDIGGYGFWIAAFYSMIYSSQDLIQSFTRDRNTPVPYKAVLKLKNDFEPELIPRFVCIYNTQRQLVLPNLPGMKLNPGSNNARLKNLADAIGVEVVAKIYQRRKNDRKLFPEYQILPGFEKYTPAQLLFLSVARQGCATTPLEMEKHMLQNGPTPYRLRINGAFRLQPSFAKAWKCKKNTFMNPKKKCQFFNNLKRHRTI